MTDASLLILVVDDEPAHAEAIRRAFSSVRADAVVEFADTLRAYGNAIATQPPAIALIDLYLPDGRAVDVLTSPAEQGAFPILVMTSLGNEQVAVEAMKAGALDYLVKSPQAFADMPRSVDRALREWRLRRERKGSEEKILRLTALLEQSQSLAHVGGSCIGPPRPIAFTAPIRRRMRLHSKLFETATRRNVGQSSKQPHATPAHRVRATISSSRHSGPMVLGFGSAIPANPS